MLPKFSKVLFLTIEPLLLRRFPPVQQLNVIFAEAVLELLTLPLRGATLIIFYFSTKTFEMN